MILTFTMRVKWKLSRASVVWYEKVLIIKFGNGPTLFTDSEFQGSLSCIVTFIVQVRLKLTAHRHGWQAGRKPLNDTKNISDVPDAC